MIEILTTGSANTVQDPGRFGYLDAGVSRSGPMDDLGFRLANLLAGNGADAAGLEIALFPFRLRFGAPVRFALAGADAAATLNDRPVPPFWTLQAAAGDVLRLDPPTRGARVNLALAGGIDVPPVLGSRATDLKSGWGGLEGRGLRRGDLLPLLPPPAPRQTLAAGGFGLDSESLGCLDDPGRVRVIAGAEVADYSPETLRLFHETDWLVSGEANRQGYRLDGPVLRPETRRELFSHGIMPGTVQLPPSGQPIIQLAEANTCGGYPKIAQVIEADLWKIGQAGPGSRLRFVAVPLGAATEALRQREAALARLARQLQLMTV